MDQNTQIEPELAEEFPRQEKYPNLLKGGVPGHDGSNAGVPKSRVRKDAGISAEQAAKLVAKALKDHESGACQLSYAQLLKSVEILNKVAFGERTEIVLDTESVLGDISEVIAEWAQESGIDGSQALALLDRIIERLGDR